MSIDWSKWPVDAELWLPNQQGTSECVVRFDENGVVWFAYSKNYGWTRWSGESKASLLARFKYTAKSWTGEGLPPVGTVCEYQTTSWPADQWEVRAVCYISDYHVVTAEKDGTERSVCADIARFRPIRTPEQIAADERESGVEGIRKAVSKSPNCKAHGLEWDVACAIYDAGYRLQVQP